jgi:hypothetical protein
VFPSDHLRLEVEFEFLADNINPDKKSDATNITGIDTMMGQA